MIKWDTLFSPDLFLQDMFERGEIEEEELNDAVYGRVVCSLCHNSVVWMYKRTREDYPDLLNQLFLVTGTFKMGGKIHLDHSWVEYRVDDKVIMLDLTLSQFRIVEDRLYVGNKLEQLNEYQSVSFGDYEGVKNMILSL